MSVVTSSVLPFCLDDALEQLRCQGLADWATALQPHLETVCHPQYNGHFQRWWPILEKLSEFKTSVVDCSQSAVSVGDAGALTAPQLATLTALLQQLMPWRKGPFCFFGVHIDAEWRSDWKWQRLEKVVSPLAGRRVLDIGCGNGYYALRMAAAGAKWVLGIDPSMLALTQLTAFTQCLQPSLPVTQLPIGVEALPPNLACFDTVFSMGVLYHRRSPFQHLEQLRSALRPGGELVLETLVIRGGAGNVLVPAERYAQMRNVWFIPTVVELTQWLQRVGFSDVRCVSESDTTVDEQRGTEWMRFHSLPQFLQPDDATLTVEGYPAPRRAILIATKPL